MTDIIELLLARDREPVPPALWDDFWDRLRDGGAPPVEVASLLASLSTRRPDARTLGDFVASLRRRFEARSAPWPRSVNIVGTGGGPATFNVSTAAALVAAAMRVPIVKSGSRAYASRCGSIDLLQQLGVPLTSSLDQTHESLHRHGIACVGYFVYPTELSLLAKAILPLPIRTLGRFFNLVGPFLADVPAAAQMTGVADRDALPALRHLAGASKRRIWLVANERGADELLSIAPSTIHPNDGASTVRLDPAGLGLATGSLADLRPMTSGAERLAHFEALLEGRGHPAALDTVCLNAAALAILAGRCEDWRVAVEEARRVLERGHAIRLLAALRRARVRRPPPARPRLPPLSAPTLAETIHA